MSKKLSLVLHTPVKGVLPRTITTACTEKVPQQAECYQLMEYSLLLPSTKASALLLVWQVREGLLLARPSPMPNPHAA